MTALLEAPDNFVATEREVPAEAFTFSGPCEFGSYDEREGPLKNPISGLARSPNALEHWYWGRVVHDLNGMTPRGETIHIDYRHWTGDLVGIANQFDVRPDGLHIGGELMSIREADTAFEIITRGREGQPYELSIDFSAINELVIEEYKAGEIVNVNNTRFEGPITVIRKWQLKSVAVCPYGHDSATNTQFAEGEGDAERPPVSVTVLSAKETPMEKGDEKKPAEDATQLEETKTETPENEPEKKLSDEPATPQDEAKATLAKFVSAFGSEKGAELAFDDTVDFEAALLEDHTRLKTELSEAREEIASLKKKFGDVSLGEEEPLKHSDSEPEKSDTPTDAGKFSHLGPAAAYAAEVAASQK